MTLVVDASVALKWFLPEPDSLAAEAVLRRADDLIAPTLLVAEVCNAAWKRFRRGETTERHLDWIADRIGRMGLALVPDLALAVPATTIARRLDHPVYDCLYLALAEARRATLVTADRRLYTRIRGTPWQPCVTLLAEFEASSGDQPGSTR
ncbi:type II toxin-antitoxin system VapC family toxin [Defluviicoccus vanus]|uniref:Ribonuclease VapC n=1 Tax=Defluviicoccus vanus TaxID=111831 RepID=A0A7H1N413_9PROT|nr:type II toxin-antitoxin system VapC family toxin [Defluviicoccus vanus]QNT70449.1 type II toxin-antitoxin system VapC family toxin [Defluviicoccus vanus]